MNKNPADQPPPKASACPRMTEEEGSQQPNTAAAELMSAGVKKAAHQRAHGCALCASIATGVGPGAGRAGVHAGPAGASAWCGVASSGQYLCQSSGRISGHVTSPPDKLSMVLQCSAGIAFSPLAIFDTKDAGTSMALATDIARPLSAWTQVLNCMGAIVFPDGETLSRPGGEFLFSQACRPISPMETVEETRRAGLKLLVETHGSMANLCEKLGYARNETATLTRILNGNLRKDRGGKPYHMGAPLARKIELVLELGKGWMDTQLRAPPERAHESPNFVAEPIAPYHAAPPQLKQALNQLRHILRDHNTTRRKTCSDLLSRMALDPDDAELADELELLLNTQPAKPNERLQA